MTEKNFFDRLKENPRPVVVDFWAPWCGPCKMIEPALKQVGKQYEGQVDVWKVNADEQPELLRSLRIYGIPTIVSFKDGQEVARQTGVASQRSLANLFDAALSGEQVAKLGLTIFDRIIRVAIGLALFFLAYTGDFSGIYLFLAFLGGVAMFSAIYDRCPLWQAITSRLRGTSNEDTSEDESAA